MKCSSYSYRKLPFSDLFSSYIEQDESIKPFFNGHPFEEADVKQRAESFRFDTDRDRVADVLSVFNKPFGVSARTMKNIENLRSGNTLAVVTGQQLTLFGGPLFTIYKTITVILYARRWEKLLNRPVVPVFWLADEDHDYDEAAEIGLIRENRFHKLRYSNGEGNLPVGRELLCDKFESFEQELFDLMPVSDFTPDIKQMLKKHYNRGESFRQAFGGLMTELFGKYGLVLAGSDDPEIKRLVFAPMLKAVEQNQKLYSKLEAQSSGLENRGFGRQVLVQESNLFYIDPENGRQKLELNGQKWSPGNGIAWDSEELAREIRDEPQKFSPNVFLRPIMQDCLLPTLAYVAGPGELSYYGQMKQAYELMDQQMPLILPRFSLTLKEPAIDRIMKELPFELHDYAGRIEDLEKNFVEKSDEYDVEKIFSSWKEVVDQITNCKIEEISKIDPTLKAAADKAGTLFTNELDDLKKKVYRSIKKQERIQLDRIHRIKENLFPGGTPQERQIAAIYYMNKYGPDMWDRLFETLEEEMPDSHKVIEL